MSEKILDGMAQYGLWRVDPESYSILCEEYKAKYREDCRAALLWLADNVSDEMVLAYMTHKPRLSRDLTSAVRESMVEAIRAAAGEEG